jgi:hypothetical protein
MRMLGDDPQVERWKNVAVWMILAAVVLAYTHLHTYALALDSQAQAVTSLIDSRDYYKAMADSAWALVGERHGLSSKTVRICMAGG